MKHRTIKILGLILTLFIVVLGALGAVCFYLVSPVEKTSKEQVSLKLASGETLRAVAADLKKQGLIHSEQFFYFYGRFYSVLLKAGIYSLSPAMSVPDIFAVLESGKQQYISLSIPEGLTIRKIAELLEKNGICSANRFIYAAKDAVLLREFNIPSQSFEGYIFPDTYNFDPEMPAEKVLRLMVNTFFNRIRGIESLKNVSSQNLHEILILASIIEREYRLAKEAPLIASVFSNRLKEKIGLYSCATLVYIITEIQGKPHPDIITNADTKIDNPYNTYKWAGLPPGPISNPGLIALNAAANPPKTNYYYFRLIDPASGAHLFSADFNKHREAAQSLHTKKAAGG